MRVDVVWWELEGTGQTVASLREQLRREGTGAWRAVPGLVFKAWLADPDAQRWGAVMLWDPDRPAGDRLPPNRAAELIGRPPTHRLRFDTEATVAPDHPRLTSKPPARSPSPDPRRPAGRPTHAPLPGR